MKKFTVCIRKKRKPDPELWVILPVTKEERQSILDYFRVSSFDDILIVSCCCHYGGLKISRKDTFDELNDLATGLSEMDEDDELLMENLILAHKNCSVHEALYYCNNINDYEMYEDVMNDKDLGSYMFSFFNLVHDNQLWLEAYVDVEALGRDFRIGAQGRYSRDGIVFGELPPEWVYKLGK